MLSLSVIIPNYNHAKFLPECLEAILSQSRQPQEILVVDDASTDESCAIVSSYQKNHPHLHLLKLKKNSGGPFVPIQESLKRVQGDYIAFCASDDIIQPGFFKESMEFIGAHPEIALCFGRFVEFQNQKPYRFEDNTLSLIRFSKVFHPDAWVKISKKHHLDIPSHAAIYKKKVLLEIGGYDQSLQAYSDYYLNSELSFKHPIGYVPKIWGASRIIQRSYGRDLTPKARAVLCGQIIKKIEREPKEIQDRWKQSGILCRAGRGMFDFLISNLKYWHYLPTLLLRHIRFKITRNLQKEEVSEY